MIITRDLDEAVGRVRTLREIQSAVERSGSARLFRIRTLLESPGFSDAAKATVLWLGSVLRGKPMPLQCVLYARQRDIRRIVACIAAENLRVVYVDGVRALVLARELRNKLPKTRIVVDFDDLMSRRFALLAQRNLPLSLGYVRKLLPAIAVRLFEGRIARWLLHYEARTLRAAEEEICRISDAVTVVSRTEAELLKGRGDSSLWPKVHAIVPPVQVESAVCRSRPPFRFVFIGSDRQTQNRLSLDALTDIWAQLRPAAPLHVYGSQTRKPPDILGIRWHGFVSDLKDVYAPGSVLVIPAVLPGGIKTKVLEAFSYGCAVLGNLVAFEGLDIRDYPLRLQESDWAPYLTAPDAHAATIERAAEVGRKFVALAGSRDRYAEAWTSVLTGADYSEPLPRAAATAAESVNA